MVTGQTEGANDLRPLKQIRAVRQFDGSMLSTVCQETSSPTKQPRYSVAADVTFSHQDSSGTSQLLVRAYSCRETSVRVDDLAIGSYLPAVGGEQVAAKSSSCTVIDERPGRKPEKPQRRPATSNASAVHTTRTSSESRNQTFLSVSEPPFVVCHRRLLHVDEF